MRSDFIRIANISVSSFNGCFTENIDYLKNNILINIEVLKNADFLLLPKNFISGNGNGSLDFNGDFTNQLSEAFNNVKKFLHENLPHTCCILSVRETCKNCGQITDAVYVTGKTHIEKITKCSCSSEQDKIFKTPFFSFYVSCPESIDDIADLSQNPAVRYCDFVFLPSAIPSTAGSAEKNQRFSQIISEMNKNVVCISNPCQFRGLGSSSTPYLYLNDSSVYDNGEFTGKITGDISKCRMRVSDIDLEIIRKRRTRYKKFDSTLCITDYNLTVCEKEPEFCNFPKEPYFDSPHWDFRIKELLKLQTMSIASRLKSLMKFSSIDKLVIGVSGGLDSTAALLSASKAVDMLELDRKHIIAVTMPGFGTSGRTYENAKKLIAALGVEFMEISIKAAVEQHFADISHDINDTSVVYENAQARERTQVLLDIANKHNGIMLATGDLSEIALGFSTFNGDHMGQFAVNACFTKTMLRHMIKYTAESDIFGKNENISTILTDILNTPVSPELLPLDEDENLKQLTENFLGQYILHEHFLYYFLKYGFASEKLVYYAEKAFNGEFSKEEIKNYLKVFLKRLYTNQFKRTCSPEGTKLTTINMFPSSYMIPSDINPKELLKAIDSI